MGMRDGLDATDGVTFTVEVIDASGKAVRVFSEHYGDTAWRPATVDLAAFAGQRVVIKLIADAGPADNTTADHALWGEPCVVTAEPVLEVRLAEQETGLLG
jgi:hypothetical protein